MSSVLLALTLSVLPVTHDCLGGPEVMGYYEWTWVMVEMLPDAACPVDPEYGQQCIRKATHVEITLEPSLEMPEPAIGQAIVWRDDAAVAVDAAGNRSDAPCEAAP